MSLVPGFCKLKLASFGLLYGTAWKKERTTALVSEAIAAGFRGIDTACQPKHYREDLVGDALHEAFQSGKLKREDVWIQTKYTSKNGQDLKSIPYNPTKPLPEQVADSVQVSRKNLKVEVIDSLVMHGPERDLPTTMVVWNAMEKQVNKGYVKHLGISNCYNFQFLKQLYEKATIKPLVVQNRFYEDSDYDKAIRKFCLDKDMIYQSFWTLTANPHIMKHNNFTSIANKHDLTKPQLMYKYLIDSGCQPLSGTTTHKEEAAGVMNLEFKLSEEDIAAITALLE